MTMSPLITAADDADYQYQLHRNFAFDFGDQNFGEADRHTYRLK
jgi:hypothetical protein